MHKIKRILFVDDDVIIGMVSKRLLEQMEVAEEIIVHTDSYEALKYIKHCLHPESCVGNQACTTLMFLDIEMPGYGGFELLSMINELVVAGELHVKNTYFVIVTSHIGEKEIAKAKSFNALAILEKPLRQHDIHTIITKLPRE